MFVRQRGEAVLGANSALSATGHVFDKPQSASAGTACQAGHFKLVS